MNIKEYRTLNKAITQWFDTLRQAEYSYTPEQWKNKEQTDRRRVKDVEYARRVVTDLIDRDVYTGWRKLIDVEDDELAWVILGEMLDTLYNTSEIIIDRLS